MAKTNLSDLLAQKAELDRTIAELQRTERAAAIAQIRTLMEEQGLTYADIGGRVPSSVHKGVKTGTKVAAKYRDVRTGQEWSGRGLQPRWLKEATATGKTLQDFLV